MNIKEQLTKMVDVQKYDSEIYFKLNLAEKEKPQELSDLEEEFVLKRQSLTEAEEALKQVQLRKKDAELLEQTKRDGLAKAEGDLYKLKSNDEYKTKLNEIANLKKGISDTEDVELELMEELSSCESEVAKCKEAFQAEEKKHNEQKQVIEKEIKTLEEEIFILRDKRTIALKQVDPQLASRYEGLVESKGGHALVSFNNGACGGCFMNLPLDVGNKIKLYEGIVYCDRCGRMLYLEDDID